MVSKSSDLEGWEPWYIWYLSIEDNFEPNMLSLLLNEVVIRLHYREIKIKGCVLEYIIVWLAQNFSLNGCIFFIVFSIWWIACHHFLFLFHHFHLKSGPFKDYFSDSSAAVLFIYIYISSIVWNRTSGFCSYGTFRWVICNITTMDLYPWN